MNNTETQGSPNGLSLHRNTNALDVWGADFERAQRMATALSSAALFPAQFKDIGSCLIVLEFSQRLQMSPFEVAQNIDLIHGRPTWKSAYILQCIAEQYEEYEFVEGVDGQVRLPDGSTIPNKTCKLVATLPNGKKREGELVSFKMAVEQGWWGRKDSKWPSMGHQMLVYRAAAFFDRKWPTGRTLGIRPADEVRDIEDAPHVVIESAPVSGKGAASKLSAVTNTTTETNSAPPATDAKVERPSAKPKAEPKTETKPKVESVKMEPVEDDSADDNPLEGAGEDDDQWGE